LWQRLKSFSKKEGSKGGLRRAGRDGTPIVKNVREGVELRSLRREGEEIKMDEEGE